MVIGIPLEWHIACHNFQKCRLSDRGCSTNDIGALTLQLIQKRSRHYRHLTCGMMLAVSVTTLSGCVSAVSSDPETSALALPAPTATPAVAAENPSAQPKQTVDATARPTIASTPAPESSKSDSSEPANIALQSTGVQANNSSIFAVQNAPVAPVAGQPTAAASVPVPGVNPAVNSLYKPAQPSGVDEANSVPLKGAGVIPKNAHDTPDTTLVTSTIPVPLPSPAVQSAQVASSSLKPTEPVLTAPAPQEKKRLTLASLFASKAQPAKAAFNENRFSSAIGGKTNRAGASAGYEGLPGVHANAMFSTGTRSAYPSVNGMPSRNIEVASLSGLARLAPNGLIVQTEKVETGCFTPPLMTILKQVESHYGKKLTVTSGYRNEVQNASAGGAEHSLHTSCQAADIQIQGVDKWELAEFLRSIPGRGGVGTYCHTESVHIDIGEQRDWNWRCRRRAS